MFESNGPEVKVRGTPQQVQEKYLALARDAQSAGDRVQAEAYFQHAEHYLRIISDDEDRSRRDQQQNQQNQQGGGQDGGDDTASANAGGKDGNGESEESRGSRGDGGGSGGGRGRGRGRGRRQAKSQDDAGGNDPASQPQPDVAPRDDDNTKKEPQNSAAD